MLFVYHTGGTFITALKMLTTIESYDFLPKPPDLF